MNKELIFLKGYLDGKGYINAIKAINLAEELHSKQNRVSGEPYITHPIRVANALKSLGIEEEDILTASILHDVIEDTPINEDMLLDGYGFPKGIVDIVVKLTKKPYMSVAEYYSEIAKCPKASIVKLSDRCHNVSTMHFFEKDKMLRYIKETESYVLPLCSKISNRYPEYSDYIYYMKYHIESILETVKSFTEGKHSM